MEFDVSGFVRTRTLSRILHLYIFTLFHLTFVVTPTQSETLGNSKSQSHHGDADWQDVCLDAVGCHLTHGDLADPGEKAKHHGAAQGITTYFDMDRLKSAMERWRKFMGSATEQKDDSKYAALRDELAAVGFLFYPRNYEELDRIGRNKQQLLKLVKASACEASAFKCAGSLAKLVNPTGPDARCGFSWGAITYARFNCSNIVKWPAHIKRVLDYTRLHCPAIRAANCPDLPDRGGGVGRGRMGGLEARGRGGSGSVYELPPEIAALNAENAAAAKREADDPKCAQLSREYKSPTTSTSPYFGELACGILRSVFDGGNMDAHVNERSSWIHRTTGLDKAQRADDWGDWRNCPPGHYATSVTSTFNGKGLQELHIFCAAPRYANETDEHICNGPLTGVKVATKSPEEDGFNYIRKFAAACASAPSGWLNDFKEEHMDEIRCRGKKVVCAYRLCKRRSDWNSEPNLALYAEGEYVFDIQLYCCDLEYPCTPGDMYVIDPALDGDYSDAEPQKLSRMFITGLDRGLSTSAGGSGASTWDVAVEGTIGFAGDAVKAGVTASGSYSKTRGHNWKQDSSMTKSETTRINVDYVYPEGLLTRYFRPVATCGVGRVLSGDKPFAVSFVNPAHCVLSEQWAFVSLVKGETGESKPTATFNVGINFTTPALTFVTGPPYLEHTEISAGLEKRLVGEYEIKSGTGGVRQSAVHSGVPPWSSAAREPGGDLTAAGWVTEWIWDNEHRRYFQKSKPRPEGGAERRSGMMARVETRHGEGATGAIPAYLDKLHEEQVMVTVPGNETGVVFQRLVRCSSQRKPNEYILVHSDEPNVLILPALWPWKDPTDEYVLVKNGKYDSWKDPGKFSYKLRVGVVWPEIESMSFTARSIDLQLKPLLADKMAKVKEGGSKNEYNWGRNEHWKVWSADAGIVKEVVVKAGEEVEIHQMVGTYKDYKIYTDHIETVVRDLSTHECKEGTGIFKCSG